MSLAEQEGTVATDIVRELASNTIPGIGKDAHVFGEPDGDRGERSFAQSSRPGQERGLGLPVAAAIDEGEEHAQQTDLDQVAEGIAKAMGRLSVPCAPPRTAAALDGEH